MKQANASALARQFEKMGLSPENIFRRFTLFGSVTTEFRRASELYED
jgi:hypothetical protein